MKPRSTRLYLVELLSAFKHHAGFSYGVPVLLDGDTAEEALRSKLVLFEDGVPLRRGHEHHGAIAGTGRGAYSHWERYLFFSTSDNTDPNKNGRSYSYAVDRTGQHMPREDGRTLLNGPFYLQDGRCWGVVVADDGDDAETETLSVLRLYEDSRPLGPSHAVHTEIEQIGSGRYSHWKRYLYFSSSDSSDPNTNGRLYSYEMDDGVVEDRSLQQPGDDGRMSLNGPFGLQAGRCWAVAVAADGDDIGDETGSGLRLYEDDRPLGPGHTLHVEIERHGGGRHSHWQRRLYFSTSDGSDPNTNGRRYSFDLDGSASVDQVGWVQPRADGRIPLIAPFFHREGLTWRVAVAHVGDVLATDRRSTLQLYEDDLPLGPRNCMHVDVDKGGVGRYSHWRQELLFSTSDGSDPNTNGRSYTYDFDG